MFNIPGYAEVKRLLAELEALEERLMPHELEMLQSLKAKYIEPLTPDSFDQTWAPPITYKFPDAGRRVAVFAIDWPGGTGIGCDLRVWGRFSRPIGLFSPHAGALRPSSQHHRFML